MKKIKIYIPVLACILASMTFSLSSCVDDKESASVTNIRDAHTEQLKAKAALDKAQAEAETIKAQAEATLAEAAKKQAEAEVRRAEAEAKIAEAEAALKLTENEAKKEQLAFDIESNKLNLEIAKAKVESEKEKAKIALEQAKVELERVRIEADIKLADLNAQLAQQQREAKDQDDEALQKAIREYKDGLTEVNKLKADISRVTIEIARLNLSATNTTAYNEENFANFMRAQEDAITATKKGIQENELAKTFFEELLNKEGVVIETEIAKLEKDKNAAAKTLPTLLEAARKAIETKNEAKDAVLDFRRWAQNHNGSSQGGCGWGQYLPEDLCAVTYYTVGQLNIMLAGQKENYEYNVKELAKLEEAYAKADKELEPNNKAMKAAMVAADKAEEEYYKVVNNPASTQDQIDKAAENHSKALEARSKAIDLFNESEDIVNTHPVLITERKYYIANWTESIESLTAVIEMYAKDSTFPYQLEDAYAKAYADIAVAWDAYYDAESKVNVLESEIIALNQIYFEYDGMDSSESIENMTNRITTLDNNIFSGNQRLARLEREIETFKENNTISKAHAEKLITDAENELKEYEKALEIAKRQVAAAEEIIFGEKE